MAEEPAWLGRALQGRIDEVMSSIERRVTETGRTMDPAVEAVFMDIARVATVAFAEWASGAPEVVAREAGRDSWRLMGQLASTREAPLNELVKRQLQWRDSVADVLRQRTEGSHSSGAALDRVLAMLQRSLDVTLVRVGSSFETERQRTHDELAHRERDLMFLANHDALTGLPNRVLLLDRLEQMLGRAARLGRAVAVVFIDIDNFKSVNDSLGHALGDELLRAVAERLSTVADDGQMLARFGGDEFVFIAGDLSSYVRPERIAQPLLETLGTPFVLSDRADLPLTVTVSSGIAIGDDTTPDALLRDADIAMYRAKRDGKNRCVVFEDGMHVAALGHLQLDLDLRAAVADRRFEVVYQPIFDLREMRPTGVKALLRWNHPQHGPVPPATFVPALEDSGLICDVGRWVLEETCHRGAAWHAAGGPVGVSVNVSGKQLDSDALIGHVRSALGQSGLPCRALTLEITETTLMSDVQATVRRLAAIRALGVRIAIDDFGTGYSSLAHLHEFPVDSLKIDRSFIRRMLGTADGDTLVSALIELGKALSIETLAEGIESNAQLERLVQLACHSGQGFLLARPLDAESVSLLLQQQPADARPGRSTHTMSENAAGTDR
ncbi:MAG TPA: bifunctional diguanylate cyclase/phosphodiesterase [Baekduia sp.]|nr:bifunctional diguanylate cyclase/phosphodiesterase [Baekduia sp.]